MKTTSDSQRIMTKPKVSISPGIIPSVSIFVKGARM